MQYGLPLRPHGCSEFWVQVSADTMAGSARGRDERNPRMLQRTFGLLMGIE